MCVYFKGKLPITFSWRRRSPDPPDSFAGFCDVADPVSAVGPGRAKGEGVQEEHMLFLRLRDGDGRCSRDVD